jgi:hypothetical protein
MPERRLLVLTPVGDDPEIGRWLASLEDGPADKLKELAGVTVPIANEDVHRVRSFDDYDAAPDWVLHHILQHQAEHRSHICWPRDTLASRAI